MISQCVCTVLGVLLVDGVIYEPDSGDIGEIFDIYRLFEVDTEMGTCLR